jgi:hypothetical protein
MLKCKDDAEDTKNFEILDKVHPFSIYITVREFSFLCCNESVLFFLILNIQSGRFEFVKKFDCVIEKNTMK